MSKKIIKFPATSGKKVRKVRIRKKLFSPDNQIRFGVSYIILADSKVLCASRVRMKDGKLQVRRNVNLGHLGEIIPGIELHNVSLDSIDKEKSIVIVEEYVEDP